MIVAISAFPSPEKDGVKVLWHCRWKLKITQRSGSSIGLEVRESGDVYICTVWTDCARDGGTSPSTNIDDRMNRR